jgi:DNA-binding beta-propeller fold protein YncE
LPVLALVVFVSGVAASVHAQTAVYNGGVTSTINSNFLIPMGVTTDSAGNIFAVDNDPSTGTATVYKMVRSGPGVYGSRTAVGSVSGSACPGTISESDPCVRGIAIDSRGNLWIAAYGDFANGLSGQVYELVNTSGTFAAPAAVGGGWEAPWGITVDPAGNVFVSDNAAATVSEISSTTISLGAPVVTTLVNSGIVQQLRGIAVDSSDNIYVIDGNVSHVMEIAPPYTSASALNPTNPYSFQGPGDLAFDASGNLWVSEYQMNNVRELTAGSNYATILAWGSGFDGPVSVWPDYDGTILVSDTGTNNHAIKQIALQPGVNFGTKAVGSTSTTQTLTFTFTGANPTTINAPVVLTQGVAGLDFADALTGSCTTSNGIGHPYNPASSCTVVVKFTPSAPGLRMGAVEILDTSGNLLAEALLYGMGTGPQLTFSSSGQAGAKLATLTAPGIPQKVAVDASGNIFVADSYISKIFKIPAGGGTPVQVAAGFSGTPYGFTIDGAGNLFVGDTDHYRIVEALAPSYSTIINVSPVLMGAPLGLAVDSSDNIYVAESGTGGVASVEEVTAASSYSSVKTLSTAFTNPFGVAVDASGNVFVADNGRSSITELVGGSSGTTHTYGSFSSPEDVALDPAGNLYVADNGGGTITELTVGTSYASSMILAKSLLSPAGVALDGKGNVYYSADGSDNSVYELDRADAPTVPAFVLTPYQTLSTDSPQTVTVSNTGSSGSNLNMSGLAVTTTTPGAANSFSLSTGAGDCSATFTLTSGTIDESCDLAVSFTPQATGSIAGKATMTDNAPGSPQVVNLSGSGTKATPIITWATPLPITYGTTLAGVLNATVKNGVNTVTGTYAYTEQVGAGSPSAVTASTVLPVGTYTLTLHFTPSDTTNYNTPTSTGVSLTVTKATPAITWPTASGITYGQTLASSTLTGGSALNGATAVSGSFAFTTPTTAPTAGTQAESVTFTPSDTGDYNPVTGSVNVVVSKATPTITWPTASGLTYGQTLASSTLTGGSALRGATNVPGTFAFTTPTTLPAAGTDPESVTFAPSDTTDYNPVTGSVNVAVAKATPTITWPTASSLTFGQTLASSTLTGGSAHNGATTVAGSFAFTTPATAPPVGTNAQSVTFTPTDTADYNPVTSTVNVTVAKATPTISWPTASSLTYGQTLASSTLSGGSALSGATAVAGSFAFTTPTTLPTAGTDSESVTFTPTDTTDYNPVTGSVNVMVSKATPTITWPSASGLTYGQTLASSTLTGGSALNGATAVTGNFAFAAPTTVPTAGTDSESVTFTPTDTTDYNPVTGNVNVVVSMATPTITWPTASSLSFGQTLASSTLTGGSAHNGATTVTGTFAFTTPTTAPPVGTNAQNVTFTPTDTANYNPVTSTVNVTVNRATPTITWPSASGLTYGQTLASSTLSGGSALSGATAVAGTFAFTTPTTLPTAGTDSESVTFTPTDTTDYNPVTGTVNVVVSKATPTITWPTAGGLTYGQTLASSTLTGGSALNGATTVAGAFAFASPSTVPTVGTDPESVTFTPTDTADYNPVTGSVNVVVSKSTPTITWPIASSITYGQTLATSALTGGSALNGSTSVPGSFAFTTPTTVPPVGTNAQSVTFTPADTANYNTVTGTVSVTVIKSSLTITWPTTSGITYGQTLASSTLTGGSALNGSTNVPGSFAFTTPTTVPAAGSHV